MLYFSQLFFYSFLDDTVDQVNIILFLVQIKWIFTQPSSSQENENSNREIKKSHKEEYVQENGIPKR